MPGDRPIRWGLMGTGNIAALFARDLELADDAVAIAAGSRRPESAAAFADRLGIPRWHGSYEALAHDPEVDVVYVATPAPAHAECALLATGAGKAVVCEKPFTLDAAQARAVVDAARAAGTFAMEAMWTRFLPHMVKVRELLPRLGPIRLVQADVGQHITDPRHRLFAPERGGGALLDLGVYPLALASMVLGRPASIRAAGVTAPTGVDLQTAALLEYDDGALAVLAATLDATTPTVAALTGRDGRIEIEAPWYKPAAFTLVAGDERARFAYPVAGRGMQYQAAEVGRCLRAGLRESPAMPLDETVAIMETLDAVRLRIGLDFPSG
jgi:predicted dehydrogenase